MSILIVDDLPDNITLLKGFLKSAGYGELITAESAEKAFDILGIGASKTAEAQIDLILMDIMMPKISGIEACTEIKKHETTKELPIIMVTAKADLQSLQAAFDAGAMDYITKPVRKIELVARVKSAISLKAAMDQRKQRESELEGRTKELEQALSEIKVLRGFIPI